MISDYQIQNITSNINLIFNIKFNIVNEYNFYVKIGFYDYGKYNKKVYDKLNQINLDACCFSKDNFNEPLKYVYESIVYEKMSEIESNDTHLKNKIVVKQ